jgi:predicted DNA-binding transcriptional regulator YafY
MIHFPQWSGRHCSRLAVDHELANVCLAETPRIETVPHADDRELIMDITKYGGDCTVIEPKALRERVAADNAERAHMMALEYSFLWRQLH